MRTKIILMILFFGFSPKLAIPQTIFGQYEEEAPLRTWNISGFVSASGLGRADIMTIIADSPGVAFNNPALLPRLPRLSFFLNGSMLRASLFRFALVNTGVLKSSNNLWVRAVALDGGGVAIKAGAWALSFGVAITEYYDRPSVKAESFSGGKTVYILQFSQQGFLRTWNLALARSLGNRFSVGLAINRAQGTIERTTEETWTTRNLSIFDQKTAEIKDIYWRLGLEARINNSLRLTLVLEPPHRQQKNNRSHYEYAAPAANTLITIRGEAKDFINRPLQMSLGGAYSLGQSWLFFLETTFFNWSKYKLSWFTEEENREYRDTFRLAFGLENLTSFGLFHQTFLLTTRLGIQIDPQPMKTPRSTYTSLSSGLSFGWKFLRLDFGAAWGQEKGSGNSLQIYRTSVALTGLF